VGTARVYGQSVPLARFVGLPPTAGTEGDLEQMSLLAGESAGLIGEIRPAAELLREFGAEAKRIVAEQLARSEPA
jgi:NAD(P)H-dependent flavin oxidoreductase YrpB (nitropropane dioxygenase family)